MVWGLDNYLVSKETRWRLWNVKIPELKRKKQHAIVPYPEPAHPFTACMSDDLF
jgi:hypothetical protein